MAKTKRRAAESFPAPMRLNEIIRNVKPRRAHPSTRAFTLRVASAALPRGYRPTTRMQAERAAGGVEIVVTTRSVGAHAFPPDIKVASIPKSLRRAVEAYDTPGLLPDHLALRPL